MSYLYDDAGRLTQKTDPRGIVTTMSYDDLDRPLGVAYSDSTPSASYTYHQGTYGIGRLSSVSNSVASTSYTYDKMGRILQQNKTIGGNAFSMSWTFNAGGLVTSYTLPNGTTDLRQPGPPDLDHLRLGGRQPPGHAGLQLRLPFLGRSSASEELAFYAYSYSLDMKPSISSALLILALTTSCLAHSRGTSQSIASKEIQYEYHDK